MSTGEMLGGVLALTRRVIEERQAWRATVADKALIFSVAMLLNRSLPSDLFTSHTAALAFLLLARHGLEAAGGPAEAGK